MAEALLVRRGGVSKPKLSSIEVHNPPTKTQYDDGETFDRTGMEVHAAYDDGHFLDVTAVASYEPDRPLTVGDTEITATYIENGVSKSTTQPITVRYLTGISVSKNPTKMDYIAGELFDPTGMEITGAFSIGSPAIVTGWDYSPKTPLGGSGVVPLDPVFENNSWATIAQACADGTVPSTWDVNSEKVFIMNGVAYTWQIIGKNHDNLHADDPKYNTAYNGGTNKAALTLMMKECYATTYRMHSSDSNYWQTCEMRNTTLPARLLELPATLQSNLRTVGKLTAEYGTTSTILTTPEKLWIPSEVEVWGIITNSKPGEGNRYAHFAAGNSRVKQRNGTAAWWWLRSPMSGTTDNYMSVSSDGSIYYAGTTANGGGLAICCCL